MDVEVEGGLQGPLGRLYALQPNPLWSALFEFSGRLAPLEAVLVRGSHLLPSRRPYWHGVTDVIARFPNLCDV